MTEYSTPSNLIKIDKHTGKIAYPNILLQGRSRKNVIGKISNYDNYNLSLVGVGIDEVSFDVPKYVNGTKCSCWDSLVDLKVIELQKYGRFQIKVSYTDDTQTVKSIVGQSLEVELAQIPLREFHVNDEEDMDMVITEYSEHKYKDGEFVPVYFYNTDNPKRSLLHMVLEDKAPHWKIGHMPTYVSMSEDTEAELASEFMRTYTEDGTSIYDFLTGTVAQETNVVFVFDTLNRVINCYSLIDCYKTDENGNRILVESGIGEDTLVFATKRNVLNQVSINSNEDQVKNCFFVEGGDDTINGMLAAVNMNGTRYIWRFAPFQLADMSEGLRTTLEQYQKDINNPEIQDEYYGFGDFNKFIKGDISLYVETKTDAELVLSMCNSNNVDINNVGNAVTKDYVASYWYIVDNTLYSSSAQRTPYQDVKTTCDTMGIFVRLCNAYQELYLKESTMSPSLINIDPQTAEIHYNNIVSGLSSDVVYVSNIKDYDSERFTGVTNNIQALAEVMTDSRYKIEIIKDTTSYSYVEGSSTGTWKGKIKVTRNTDDTNTYPIDIEHSQYITVTVCDGSTSDGQYEFVKQKIMKALASSDMQNLDFDIEDDVEDIKTYFNQYALNRLNSFYDAYNECVSVLEKYGLNIKSDVQETLYQQYQKVLTAIAIVRTDRQEEVNSIKGQIETLTGLQAGFADKYNLDLRKRLGNELYEEFCSYRREDTYSNPNYISDNKETVAEQLQMAKELIDVANAELGKACMLQRTVSTSLGNLLVLPEFEQLYDSFALFNYIRIQTDDEILKLRLIGIEFSGDSVQDINVTFSEQIESVDKKTSDIESILNSAQSMATSFPITVRQAKQGESANKEFIDIHTNGLSATKAMITNNDNNEVTITNIGLLAKRMDDEGYYGKKQLRITGNGMYLTDDAWENLRMAVGEIIYTNPITGNQERAYGMNCETLIGNLIAGNQMYIGNKNGSVQIDGDGIKITNGKITWGSNNVNAPTIDDIPELPSELQSIDEQLEQLDGRIQTYSQPNDPSVDWTTSTEKQSHKGDLWVNPQTGITKQWTGTSWIEVTDSYLKSLASSKAQIFTSQPTDGYFEGDMIIPVNDFTYSGVTYTKNKVYRAYRDSNGKTFSTDDWDTLDYTNDDELTDFVTTTYANNLKDINSSIGSINTQLDKKADTYYQATIPTWTDGNSNHVGDMWYCTKNVGNYVAGKTYMYDGTTWKEVENVPDSVFDMIDGKRQIFVSKPTSATTYRTGDLWIINETDCTNGKVTVNGTEYKPNSTLVAKLPNGVTERTSFVESDWYDISTHDGIIALDQSTQALQKFDDIADDSLITPTEKQQLKLLMENITSEKNQILNQCAQYSISVSTSAYYSDWQSYNTAYGTLNTCVSNILSNSDMKDTISVPSNYASSFRNYYNTLAKITEDIEKATKVYSDNNLSDYKKEVKKFQDKVNTALTGSTTEIGSDYVISPKIGGGYLYIANNKYSVEIDPNHTSSNTHGDYLFCVKDKAKATDNIIMGVTNEGDGYFSGTVYAKTLRLGSDASVPSSKVDGLSAVATSGKYSDLSDKPTIPSDISDLADSSGLLSNIVYNGDIKTSTGTDAYGNTYRKYTVPTSSGNYTYTAYETDNYLLFGGVGKGSASETSTDNYFCVSKEGLMQANNAWIRGTIYATDGVFNGTIYATDGKFAGTLEAAKGTFNGIVDINGTNGVGAITVKGNATTDRVQVYGTKDSKTSYSRQDLEKFYVGDNESVTNANNGIYMSVWNSSSNIPSITGWSGSKSGYSGALFGEASVFNLTPNGLIIREAETLKSIQLTSNGNGRFDGNVDIGGNVDIDGTLNVSGNGVIKQVHFIENGEANRSHNISMGWNGSNLIVYVDGTAFTVSINRI